MPQPISTSRFLKNGTANVVARDGGSISEIHRAAAKAIMACRNSFNRPDSPLLLRLRTFR